MDNPEDRLERKINIILEDSQNELSRISELHRNVRALYLRVKSHYKIKH